MTDSSYGCPASASLKSKVIQRLPTTGTDVPGPAQYEPEKARRHIPDAGLAKTGRDARYVGDTITGIGRQTDVTVGPGTYEPAHVMSGDRSTIAAHVGDNVQQGLSWTVVSDSVRTALTSFFEMDLRHAMQF